MDIPRRPRILFPGPRSARTEQYSAQQALRSGQFQGKKIPQFAKKISKIILNFYKIKSK